MCRSLLSPESDVLGCSRALLPKRPAPPLPQPAALCSLRRVVFEGSPTPLVACVLKLSAVAVLRRPARESLARFASFKAAGSTTQLQVHGHVDVRLAD